MTCKVLFVLLVSRVILLCLLKKQTRPNHRSFLTPKKWPFFTKSAITKSNSYFFTKILTCPNFLDVRASTNVKRGQNSNLNLIKIGSEHDKTRCISVCYKEHFAIRNNFRITKQFFITKFDFICKSSGQQM